jgi:hypothetical protein
MVMRSERRQTRKVLMNFMAVQAWHVSFLEPDCQTSLPVKLTFKTPAKIRTMQQRFGSSSLEDRQSFEHGLSIGRGGVWLTLSEDQYRKLKAPTRLRP